MAFKIIRNDITKVKADAIVNSANPRPIYDSGTDRAIYQAAGEEKLLAERKKIGNIGRGESAVTAAFDLNAKYIIHTVGPMWEEGNSNEFEILRNCYVHSLQKALELKCESIAFPLIATGIYGFPKDKALQIAISVFSDFLMEHEMQIILVVFDKKSFQLSGKLMGEVESYIDSNYIKDKRSKEYSRAFLEGESRNRESEEKEHSTAIPEVEKKECLESVGELKESKYSESTTEFKEIDYLEDASELEEKKSIEFIVRLDDKNSGSGKSVSKNRDESGNRLSLSLAYEFEHISETFHEKLYQLIEEAGLNNKDVWKLANLDRKHFSKIQCDPNYHPKKKTVMALCIALQLDLEQSKDLMARADWAFSPSSKVDLIVQKAIMDKQYDIMQLNLVLFEYTNEVLGV